MSFELTPRRLASGAGLAAALRVELEAACEVGSGRLIALAVGRTTLPLYRELEGAAGLARKAFLPLDELIPPPALEGHSFSATLGRALPPRLSGRLRPIDVEGDAKAECAALEREIESEGLCACVLGLGPDGHVAFNQPGSGVDTRTRIVDVEPENLGRLGDVSPARQALTLGIATLLGAESIVLVVAGPDKSRAIDRVLRGPEGADVPATWLRRHPRCRVLIAE